MPKRISPRNVHVCEQVWKWYVKIENLVLFDPDKKRYEIDKDVFYHLMRKDYAGFRASFPPGSSITPGDVAEFIETFVMPLQIVETETYVSLTMTDGLSSGGFTSFAVADMDKMEDHWWFSRLHVNGPWQRLGYGTWLVDRLKSLAKGKPIFVVPGGYDFPREAQIAFYTSCGFVEQTEGKFAGGMLFTKKRKGSENGEKKA